MPDKDFGNVELPGGFSEKELRWSYWWINNRDKVKRAGVGVLIGIDVLLLGFGLWGFTDWLVVSGVGEDRAVRTLASNAYGRLGLLGEAQELAVQEPIVFDLPGGLDLLAMVENANARTIAQVTYRFKVGEAETPERTTWIMPGQSKYLTELGWKPEEDAATGIVELRIVKRVWSRIDAHAVADPQEHIVTRFQFEVSKPVFTPPETGATVPVGRSFFTVRNNSPYGYYDVDLLVLLYRGDTPVAASKYRVNRFPSGRIEPVELFWYQSLQQVTRTEVIPDVNVFDPDAYLPTGR